MNPMPSLRPPSTTHLLCDLAIHAVHRELRPVYRLTETIFSWPGIGKWMIDSISRRDYPVVQSGLLLIAGIVMIVNLLVDLTYGLINPRIRHK